jgi:hypothetical protein
MAQIIIIYYGWLLKLDKKSSFRMAWNARRYQELPQDAMDANTKSYINERLISFTQKLFKKATREMRLYFAFQIIIIVFSALIPIVNVVPAVLILTKEQGLWPIWCFLSCTNHSKHFI